MFKWIAKLFQSPRSIEDELLIAHHELLLNPVTSYTMDKAA